MSTLRDKSKLTDQELIAEYRSTENGDVIGILFNRYTHLIYGVCLKYLRDRDDSKDAVMQVFEKLPSDLLRYEIQYFKSWLYAVAKNHCLMLLRSKKGIYHQSFDESYNANAIVEMQSGLHHDGASEKEELLTRLEEGVKQLNDQQRLCIELFYLQEKSYQEVAQITGFTMMKVKSYIQNGKRNLKIILEKNHAG